MVGCLLAVIARGVWAALSPYEFQQFAGVLQGRPVWAAICFAAQVSLVVEFALFAGSLTLYQRERSGDLMPGWVLWAMALALIFLCAGSLACALTFFVPIYRTWIICHALAACCLGVSMSGYPMALKRLVERRPMRELEASLERLERAQASTVENRNEIHEVKETVARLLAHVGQITSRTETLSADFESLASHLNVMDEREGKIYEQIADARSLIVATSER